MLGPGVAENVLVEVLARPDPNQNRPGSMSAIVAAAWARIAGWIRWLSAVTPVPIVIRSVASAIPPSTDQANGLCPWRSVQGWK